MELKYKTLLTRYKMSSNDSTFKTLLHLMNSGFEDVWNLICYLRTNPTIYVKVLTQDSDIKDIENKDIY